MHPSSDVLQHTRYQILFSIERGSSQAVVRQSHEAEEYSEATSLLLYTAGTGHYVTPVQVCKL